MARNKTEARTMDLRDLVQSFYINAEHRAAVDGPVLNEWMLKYGIGNLYDLCVTHSKGSLHNNDAPRKLVDTSQTANAEFPWINEEHVSSWMRTEQLWQLAQRVLDSGYRGEGMLDPEGAMDWVESAIQFKKTWADVPAEGARFWKSLKSRWERWLVKSGKLHLTGR